MNKKIIISLILLCLCAFCISIYIRNNQKSFKPRITDSKQNSILLTGENADKYGVYPSKDFQFALYTLTLEVDHKITITHYVITSYSEGYEQVERCWIDGEFDNYVVETKIIEDKVIDGQIAAIANYTIYYRNERIMYDHINFVMDSFFTNYKDSDYR